MTLLKNPKTIGEFNKTHTGASVTKQPGTAMAAINAQTKAKIASVLIKEAASKFKQLEANKKPLTDEERAEVMAAKAVWHHGPNGEETPAVWKSIDKNGKITYITHTHRAYNTAPTLKGAIGRYHKFIKSTA